MWLEFLVTSQKRSRKQHYPKHAPLAFVSLLDNSGLCCPCPCVGGRIAMFNGFWTNRAKYIEIILNRRWEKPFYTLSRCCMFMPGLQHAFLCARCTRCYLPIQAFAAQQVRAFAVRLPRRGLAYCPYQRYPLAASLNQYSSSSLDGGHLWREYSG